MRYYLVVIVICMYGMVYSQISTTRLPEGGQNLYVISALYDSTRNFLGENVGQYIGQVLFLKGMSETLRKYGYDDFYKDYQVIDLHAFSNVYKGNKRECEFNTPYNSIAGRYFKVLSIIKHPKSHTYSYLYGSKYFMLLEDNETRDTLYYQYDSKYSIKFPFLVVGFVEKQKASIPGSRYVFSYDALMNSLDIKTGTPVSNIEQDIWTCTEFVISESNFEATMIVANESGETTHVPWNYVYDRSNSHRKGYTLQEAVDYSERFGHTNWDYILEGKVVVGFTEEMARLSWGDPKEINHASYGDQWVYNSQYLYFENGVLKSFN